MATRRSTTAGTLPSTTEKTTASQAQPAAKAGETHAESKPRSRQKRGRSGARHHADYHDTHEDYIPVSRARLRELSNYTVLQEGTGAAGIFLFSGAFWEFIRIVAEHSIALEHHWEDAAPWLLAFIISMAAGGVLTWVSVRHFRLKRQYIEDLFAAANRDGPSAPGS
jgi:hypothetical protein